MTHAIDVAQTEVGVVEASGQNDGIPFERYGRTEVGRGAVRTSPAPWCALFVMWCFEQSTDPNPHQTVKEWWRYASVKSLEAGMKARGLWMGWAVEPEPNDIVFFATRGRSDPGRGRHVGLVEKVAGDRVHTVEGNTSNGVKRRDYPLSSKRITGYARMCAVNPMEMEAFRGWHAPMAL